MNRVNDEQRAHLIGVMGDIDVLMEGLEEWDVDESTVGDYECIPFPPVTAWVDELKTIRDRINDTGSYGWTWRNRIQQWWYWKTHR